jgi:hypothetical protein
MTDPTRATAGTRALTGWTGAKVAVAPGSQERTLQSFLTARSVVLRFCGAGRWSVDGGMEFGDVVEQQQSPEKLQQLR